MNTVNIEIDDETKTLKFVETLTTGSTYKVVLEGCGATVGAGSLILMDGKTERRQPIVFASADLAVDGDDVTGTLDLSTSELIKWAIMAPGEISSIYAVIHSDTYAENVAVGNATIRLIPIATDETTGAAILFKGDKGDAGRGIASVADDGTDADTGARIVKVVFSDGSTTTFTVPKGTDGTPAKMTAIYNGSTGKWHQIQAVSESETGELVVAIDRDEVDLSEFPASEASALEAYNSAKLALERKEGAEAAQSAAETAQAAAEAAKTGAETAQKNAEAAQTSAETAAANASTAGATSGAEAGASAGQTAAQSVIDESRTTLEGYVSEASTAAASASESSTNASEYAKTAKEHAESAASYAEMAQLAEAQIDPENLVHRSQDETVDGVKTFSSIPVIPDEGDEDNSSPAASVNHVKTQIDSLVSKKTLYSITNGNIASNKTTPTAKTAAAGTSFTGDTYAKTILIATLIQSVESVTYELQISYDKGFSWTALTSENDGAVVLRKTVEAGSGEAFRIRAYGGTATQYKWYLCKYLNIDIPEEELEA